MIRIIATAIWLLLSAWLLVWVWEGLFGVDQRSSVLPLQGEDTIVAPIAIGVVWGLILTFGGTMGGLLHRSKLRGETQLGVGRVVEVNRTGMTVNDVPQYELFVRVTTAGDTEFVGSVRMLVEPIEQGALQQGVALPIRYTPSDHDTLEIADMTDPAVREAMLEWRIQRGLIPPHLVRARRSSTQAPASVLSLRPTGVRRDGQSELDVRLLVSPDGQQSWEVDTTVFVHPDAMSRVQVGSPVWARYLPVDPRTVAMTIEREA